MELRWHQLTDEEFGLLDQCADEFEKKLKNKSSVQIEDWLERADQHLRPYLIYELIHIEVKYNDSGKQDYLSRLPEYSHLIDGIFSSIPRMAGTPKNIELRDNSTSEKILPLVYQELVKLAAAKLRNEPSDNLLQPTLLVHEAFIRLVDKDSETKWNSHGHFFGAAAEAMRRILVESARRKNCRKRGGDWNRIELENLHGDTDSKTVDMLDLDEALSELEVRWPAKAKLVTLRYFAGLTIVESSQVMGISHATAERYWAFAKTWLFARLSGELK